MIHLDAVQLGEYQKRTQYISKNNLIPVLANIKLHQDPAGNFLLTKTNLAATYTAPVRGLSHEPAIPALLLDERILFGLVAQSKGEDIIVSWNEKTITLTAGKGVADFAREDVANFPNNPEMPVGLAAFPFTPEHLRAIDIARNYLGNETSGSYQFVHLKEGIIAGFHSSYFYVNNSFADLPTMQLNKEQADIISGLEAAELQVIAGPNHYFLKAGVAHLIFTRAEGQTPNLPSVLTRLQTPGKDFTINRDELLDFCQLANLVSETPIADCSMVPAGPFATLKLVDANYGRGSQREIGLAGTFDEFNFNSRLIAPALKVVPYLEMQCKTVANCLIVTGQQEYFCFLGMQKK